MEKQKTRDKKQVRLRLSDRTYPVMLNLFQFIGMPVYLSAAMPIFIGMTNYLWMHEAILLIH
jgi:hypothetical protein